MCVVCVCVCVCVCVYVKQHEALSHSVLQDNNLASEQNSLREETLVDKSLCENGDLTDLTSYWTISCSQLNFAQALGI